EDGIRDFHVTGVQTCALPILDAWAASICFNTVEAGKLGLPAPTSWKDLADPVYAGRIIMPNPNSSGTGFLDVSSWLQLFGEDERSEERRVGKEWRRRWSPDPS